jgi:predicted patatin/cPLA2 family phospholipase
MRMGTGRASFAHGVRGFAVAALCILLTAGCATVERVAYTQQEQTHAVVPGFPDARVWADDPIIAQRGIAASAAVTKQPTILALSGGGADGAFGAGLLTGWTARGNRPQFSIVTGASAGALMAPFAYLGSGYDEVLRSVFASGEMENFLQFEGVSGIVGSGLFKAGPLRELIAKYVDAGTLEAVAQQYRTGRKLFIVTTNLDAQRTAIWDMGRIASSGNPKALDLFRKVMEASASIPGIFSPVLIDVEAEGKAFAEMHVDGGVTANIMVVPEAILVANKAALPQSVRPKVYIVINGKLDPYFEVVKPRTLQIAIRSFETSVRANTRNALLATYEFAKRRSWQVNIAAIEDHVPNQAKPGFDTAYMRTLFEYGYERGKSGQLWQPTPAETIERQRAPKVAASQQ